MVMVGLQKGRYATRFACDPFDMARVLDLRAGVFRATSDAPDADAFDPACRHLMIEDITSNTLVGCCRLLPVAHGRDVAKSYSAQFYDLSRLATFQKPMVEMGRFCVLAGQGTPDLLRVAWAAITRFVDETGGEMLFGCASFEGTVPESYSDVFALLRDRHLAPRDLRALEKAADVFRFGILRARGDVNPEREQVGEHGVGPLADAKQAMRRMPPLLRSYLGMGARVSDHAVIDHNLNTLHVLVTLDVRDIPAARVRLLRATAQ
jgi:putative hemolysin